MSTDKILARVADTVSRRYARLYPWIDRGDLVQEAWATMLPMVASYDPALGDLAGYLYKAARRACRLLVWKLSAATGRPTRTAPLEPAIQARAGLDALECVESGDQTAEELLADAQRRTAMAQLVARYLAEGRDGEAVASVLLQGERPAEVAARLQMTPERVWWLTSRTRAAIRSDLAGREVL